MADRVAIVTGASRGIGRAVAQALGGEGATVILSGRDGRMLAQSARLVEQSGGRACVFEADLAAEEDIKALTSSAEEKFGRLDILVNNAGITHSAALVDTTTDEFDTVMAINARAPFILCREALPALKRSDRAFIINISSVVGVKGYPLQSAYTASKHALRGMSIALAEELRPTNVRVHVLCPGGVATDMVQRVRPDIPSDELISADEIAELVRYLVTHEGNAVVDELHIRRATSGPWF